MKKNILALALTLMLASTTAFADGETGHGNRACNNTSAATACIDGETGHGNRTSNNSDLSSNLLDQFLNVIYAIIA